MPAFEITITGNANIPHLAERANVRLSATTEGPNKQSVSDSVLTTAEHIESQIHDIQARYSKPSTTGVDPTTQAIAHWSKTSLTSTSRIEAPVDHRGQHAEGGESKRLFTAKVDFDIRFQDFEALGDFSARLSALDHCEIYGVTWKLLPATEASFEARLRKEAAADALLKAQDFCSVFCKQDKQLCIVPAKLNFEQSYGQYGGRSVQTARRSTSGAAFTFSPQECTMSASLEVVFNVETKGIDVNNQGDEQ